MAVSKKRFVVVTTAHRGVFAGYLANGSNSDEKTVELAEAQMCVYWSADIGGVLGLAVTGPSKSCRIGPAVPKIVLQDVTSVMDATKEAEEKWQAKPWS